MKKILTLLTLVLLSCMGTWAEQVTLTPSNGTYTRGVGGEVKPWSSVWTSETFNVNGHDVIVRFTSSGGNYIWNDSNNSGYLSIGSNGIATNTFTLSVVSDYYYLSGYSWTIVKGGYNGIVANINNNEYTVNTTVGNQNVIVGGLGAESTTFTVTGSTAGQANMIYLGDIKINLIEQSKVINLWTKPQFGGTVWTWNKSTNKFDASGQTSTAAPERLNNKGPVYTFNGVGTVTTSVSGTTDTSDSGGIRILGNGDNVTSNIGRWAGSIEVEEFAIANVTYSQQLKGTEPTTAATVWVNGELNITGRTNFNMDDGTPGGQRWYIGESGVIKTGFTAATRGGRTWDLQVVVADDPVIAGVIQTEKECTKKVLTWGADLSGEINSVKVYHKDAAGNLTELSDAVSYDASGITVTYNALVNADAEFTYVYKYDGVEKHRETVSKSVGSAFPDAAAAWAEMPFGINAATPSGNVSAETAGQEIDITLTSALPFEFFADYASVNKWYALQGHSNNHHWVYSENGALTVSAANATRGVTSAYAWAFIGDPFTGIKIVNKGATEANDETLTMISDEDPCTLTTSDNAVKFVASDERTLRDGYFCFKTTGTYYNLNTNTLKISRWNDADAGSTFKVEEFVPDDRIPCDITVNYTAGNHSWTEIISTYEGELTAEDVAVDFYTNFNITTANKTISESNTTFNVTCEEDFPFTSGVATRIQSRGDGHQNMDFFNGDTYPQYAASGFAANTNLWVFEHVANSADLFTVKNVATGKYLTFQDGTRKQGVLSESIVNTGANTSYFRIRKSTHTSAPIGAFCLQHPTVVTCCYGPHINDTGYGDPTSNGLGGWAAGSESVALGNDQNCLIALAPTSYSANLAATDGTDYYGSIYLPYTMTLPEGVEAYAAAQDGEVLKLTKVGVANDVLPAGAYILYGGTSNTPATLALGAAATVPANGNALDGRFEANVALPTGSNYVLNDKNNVVGFYKYTKTTYPVAKAVFNVPEGSPSNAFAFRFEDVTTAIDALHNNNSGAEIFDLQGRRLTKAQKGMNIINGHKVLVK